MSTDVVLFLEGTYPYVPGGVSSWVHQLLNAYPLRKFALVHIGPTPDSYGDRAFELPENVQLLRDVYCRGGGTQDRGRAGHWLRYLKKRREPSRVLDAIRRLHLQDEVDDQLVADLAAGDLSVREFIHGRESFELMRSELYPRLGPGASFVEFFWHFRALHIPLLRLLNEPVPPGRLYHAVATGYAGLLAAVASARSRTPLVITEHGIYAREREIELARANWIRDNRTSRGVSGAPSPLRRLWAHFFLMLSRVAYKQATRVVTLSETNRRRQLLDGADPAKTSVVPNGVDRSRYDTKKPSREQIQAGSLRVGFVGRVVPIKDVITLIRAASLAVKEIDLQLWIVGPEAEDPKYVTRCKNMVRSMGLSENIRFLGRQPMSEIYPQLDALVLTSISEGQPLVILEAFASGLPVVATDVGACAELIRGNDDDDRRIGPAGLVTRVASPTETAAALIFLAKRPETRRKMGESGRARVSARYRQQQVVERYDELYSEMVSP